MYQLFIGNKNYSSWSLRPWALLRELEIPFAEKLVPFHEGGSWAQYRAFSPTGKVPCLQDGDTVVWDSLGITEYVAERHAGVWPADPAARAWARCVAAEMHSGYATLRHDCSMSCGIRVQLPSISAALQKDLERLQEVWSQGLDRFGGPFLAGERFTAVDAFFTPVAFRVQTYGLKLSPRAMGYVERLLALPSARAWYADALVEPWREIAHEEEIRRAGTVLQDLRWGAHHE